MRTRVATAVGLVVIAGISIVRTARPPRPVPATAPDTVFSAERAMRHVEAIALEPHAMGMPAHDRVRDYIVGQLTAYGLHPQIQQTTGIGTRYRVAGRVQNILTWVPGRDAKGKAVLLVAHYDGVEAGPAAADDGAGSAALLETIRALRARKAPLAHDIIALFTDGEEAGLLGAAAFVREHPWAKDVAIVLNFEARGTTGRSFMFETGPGNFDAVSALRRAGNATAGSVFTTVYRALPNDTDLSELSVLGLPALNFAFVDGVERYHTSHDDVAHLNPGSVQHHGSQMLALAAVLASDTLPRPLTTDGIFFDLPVVGLVLYPIFWAVPIAVIAAILVVAVIVRVRRGIVVGFIASLATIALSGLAASVLASGLGWIQARLPWGGNAQWSGWHALALSTFVLAISIACHTLARRWSSDDGLHAGSLVVWLLIAAVLSVKAPGASYLFVWPLLLAAAAAVVPPEKRRVREVALWTVAGATLLLLAGLVYGVSVITLGVRGSGAVVLGLLVSLIEWLLAPLMGRALGDEPLRGAGGLASLGVALSIVAFGVTGRSAEHPIPSALAYVQGVAPDAWLGTSPQFNDAWTNSAVGPRASTVDGWTGNAIGHAFAGRKVPLVRLGAPTATLLRDTVFGNARRVVLRVTAPPGTIEVLMMANGPKVLTSSIDGRGIDTTRYRGRRRNWAMTYAALPDSGVIVALSVAVGAKIDFQVTSRRQGIPPIPGVSIPPRPAFVVPIQTGDASYVYRQWYF